MFMHIFKNHVYFNTDLMKIPMFMHIFKNHVYSKRVYAMIMKIPMFMHMITNENNPYLSTFLKMGHTP